MVARSSKCFSDSAPGIGILTGSLGHRYLNRDDWWLRELKLILQLGGPKPWEPSETLKEVRAFALPTLNIAVLMHALLSIFVGTILIFGCVDSLWIQAGFTQKFDFFF